MFGYKKTAGFAAVLRGNEMQVWDLGADPAKRKGFPIRGEPFVGTLPPALDARGTEIRFAGDHPNAAEFAAIGWEVTGGPFSFSTAKTAVLYLQPGAATRDVEMTRDVFPPSFPRPRDAKDVDIARTRAFAGGGREFGCHRQSRNTRAALERRTDSDNCIRLPRLSVTAGSRCVCRRAEVRVWFPHDQLARSAIASAGARRGGATHESRFRSR